MVPFDLLATFATLLKVTTEEFHSVKEALDLNHIPVVAFVKTHLGPIKRTATASVATISVDG